MVSDLSQFKPQNPEDSASYNKCSGVYNFSDLIDFIQKDFTRHSEFKSLCVTHLLHHNVYFVFHPFESFLYNLFLSANVCIFSLSLIPVIFKKIKASLDQWTPLNFFKCWHFRPHKSLLEFLVRLPSWSVCQSDWPVSRLNRIATRKNKSVQYLNSVIAGCPTQ